MCELVLAIRQLFLAASEQALLCMSVLLNKPWQEVIQSRVVQMCPVGPAGVWLLSEQEVSICLVQCLVVHLLEASPAILLP